MPALALREGVLAARPAAKLGNVPRCASIARRGPAEMACECKSTAALLDSTKWHRPIPANILDAEQVLRQFDRATMWGPQSSVTRDTLQAPASGQAAKILCFGWLGMG